MITNIKKVRIALEEIYVDFPHKPINFEHKAQSILNKHHIVIYCNMEAKIFKLPLNGAKRYHKKHSIS